MCLACNGSGVVIVTEVTESPSELRKSQIEKELMEIFSQNSSDANNGQMSVITEDSYSDTIDDIIEYLSSRPDSKGVSDPVQTNHDYITGEFEPDNY